MSGHLSIIFDETTLQSTRTHDKTHKCVFAIKRHFDKFEPMFGKLNVVGRSWNNVSFQNPLQTADTFTAVELDKERMQELAD